MLPSRAFQSLTTRFGRLFTSSLGSKSSSEGEQKMFDILKARFPNAVAIDVTDVSGGCGSMYRVSVECSEFEGKTRVQQHRMVTDTLKKEIPSMHGIVIETKALK